MKYRSPFDRALNDLDDLHSRLITEEDEQLKSLKAAPLGSFVANRMGVCALPPETTKSSACYLYNFAYFFSPVGPVCLCLHTIPPLYKRKPHPNHHHHHQQ